VRDAGVQFLEFILFISAVIPAKAGIQLIEKFPRSGSTEVLSASQSIVPAGFRPDETTSHSTKLAKNASKVAGYSPE
jgi:hypothetical protein